MPNDLLPRWNTFNEIVETERQYVKQLGIIICVCFPPFLSLSSTSLCPSLLYFPFFPFYLLLVTCFVLLFVRLFLPFFPFHSFSFPGPLSLPFICLIHLFSLSLHLSFPSLPLFLPSPSFPLPLRSSPFLLPSHSLVPFTHASKLYPVCTYSSMEEKY